MADNVNITPGTGDVVAADDIAGAKHQRIKLVLGADGVSDGDVSSTNPMPISAANLPLPSGAATAALQTTGNSSLSSIDGKIPASPSQEHVTAGSPHAARLTDGTSFYKATTPTDTQPISAASLPLPAGAATQATLASIDAGIPAALGQTTMAASMPVTLASDQSAVSIQDGGNVITVDGSVGITGTVDTELPAAAALVDGASNPTTPTAGAAALIFNGTTWDRARGDITNGLDVDVTRVQGNVTVVQATASNFNATIGNAGGASAVNIQDGGNSITVDGTVTANIGTTGGLALDATVGRAQGSTTSGQTGPLVQGAVTTAAPTYTTGQTSPLSLATTGGLRVTEEKFNLNFGAAAGAVRVAAQLGNATASADFGSGALSAQTLRTVLATNQPQINVSANEDANTRLGVYYVTSGALLVQAAADAATVGRVWLINPVGSAVTVRVRKIRFESQLGSALAAVTSPRITLERVTFTGTASGATIASAKRRTADATQVSSLRTASTGLTLTAVAVVAEFLPIASATAVGYTATTATIIDLQRNEYIELAAGEGLVVRQPDAGTAADTRRYFVNFTIEEV